MGSHAGPGSHSFPSANRRLSVTGPPDPDITYDLPLPRPPAVMVNDSIVAETYQMLLEQKVEALRTDYESGARELATDALNALAKLIRPACVKTGGEKQEAFVLIVYAAKQFRDARPPMGAAISSLLLRAIAAIEKAWSTSSPTLSDKDITTACDSINSIIASRAKDIDRLERYFTSRFLAISRSNVEKKGCCSSLHILTLSMSSTIRIALLAILKHHAEPSCRCPLPRITVLESRPRCEGVDLVKDLVFQAEYSMGYPLAKGNLDIIIAPDCAVASIMPYVDVVLLGADRIDPDGDVSNKIGSLAAVCCARQLQPDAVVMVLSDTDKIVGRDEASHRDAHGPKELADAWSKDAREQLLPRMWDGERGPVKKGVPVTVFGDWFETVPALMVGEYMTERGMMTREEIRLHSAGTQAWSDKYFGKRDSMIRLG